MRPVSIPHVPVMTSVPFLTDECVIQSPSQRRRQVILEKIGKDPCALDVLVWVAPPLVPSVLDRLFEACASNDPPLRWALLGPREEPLASLHRKLQASVPDMPFSFMPKSPVGSKPYLIPVEEGEIEVFKLLASRALVALQLSQAGMPAALHEACAQHFVDVLEARAPCVQHFIDTLRAPPTAGPVPRSPRVPEKGALAARGLAEGCARVRGGVVQLGGVAALASPEARGWEALALIRSAVEVRGFPPHVCNGGQLCTSGACSAGKLRARL